jgi:hypothetical protein
MRNIARAVPYSTTTTLASVRWAVWNRRLLTAAFVLVMWAASILGLQVAGPEARALVAGEGMSITTGTP